MRLRRIVIAFDVLLVAILACNLPAGQNATQTPDLAATITAQALQLQTPVSTVALASTPATASIPEASVSSPTNCRTGPSTAYSLVFTANPGPKFQVVGKNTPDDYWIIDNPTGGTCWLWGQNATVSGDTAGLPEYPAPSAPQKPSKTPKSNPTSAATATSTSASGGPIVPPIFTIVPIVPSAPGNLNQSHSCAGGFSGINPIWIEDVTLAWQASAGQSGYRVYKDGALASMLPASATSYNIQLRYNQGTGGVLFYSFGVEAFNAAGASSRPSVDVAVCP